MSFFTTSNIKKAIPYFSALLVTLVTILGLSGCSGGSSSASDPTVSLADVSIDEGNSGSTNLVFTLTASSASDADITVNYETTAGTATANTDYTETSGSVVVLAGRTSATIEIPVIGDTVFEGDETLTLTLTAATGADLGTLTATGTILNDDSKPSVSIADASVVEGNSGQTNLVFTLTASNTSDADITVTYATSDGTATAGSDYVDTSGSVDIPSGSTSVTITVPVKGDADIEDDETLSVTLSAATGATLDTTSATGTILNDDHADPSGYYSSGSATIKDPANAANDLVLSDLKAMVNGNRMLIVSPSTSIVYDATITGVTQHDFTANVTLYYGMDSAYNVLPPTPILTTMTGTITEGSQITGEIAGTGVGAGSFTLTYSQTNSTAADVANVVSSWVGAINTISQLIFDFKISNTSGDIAVDLGSNADDGIFKSCKMLGGIESVGSSTLYTINLNLTSCYNPEVEGVYTGLATTTNSNHDTLVTVFTNGTASFSAELSKP